MEHPLPLPRVVSVGGHGNNGAVHGHAEVFPTVIPSSQLTHIFAGAVHVNYYLGPTYGVHHTEPQYYDAAPESPRLHIPEPEYDQVPAYEPSPTSAHHEEEHRAESVEAVAEPHVVKASLTSAPTVVNEEATSLTPISNDVETTRSPLAQEAAHAHVQRLIAHSPGAAFHFDASRHPQHA